MLLEWELLHRPDDDRVVLHKNISVKLIFGNFRAAHTRQLWRQSAAIFVRPKKLSPITLPLHSVSKLHADTEGLALFVF